MLEVNHISFIFYYKNFSLSREDVYERDSFKAKSKQTREWVEGYLYCDKSNDDEYKIIRYEKWFGEQSELVMRVVPVDPETICQWTGFTDKNGVKIWENDIMEFSAYSIYYKGIVSFMDGNFCVLCEKAAPFLDDAVKKHSAFVTGNIHNKEEHYDSRNKIPHPVF